MPRTSHHPVGVVYLLHFSAPLHHARHYLGFTESLPDRVAAHRGGRGGRLPAAVIAAGLTFEVARQWTGVTRAFERRAHRLKHGPALCPICSAGRPWPLAPRDAEQPDASRRPSTNRSRRAAHAHR